MRYLSFLIFFVPNLLLSNPNNDKCDESTKKESRFIYSYLPYQWNYLIDKYLNAENENDSIYIKGKLDFITQFLIEYERYSQIESIIRQE